MSFKKGDLIKWYETYADIFVIKDCGMGVIIDITTIDYFAEPYYSFKVFRTEKNDFMIFERHNLEEIKEKQVQ